MIRKIIFWMHLVAGVSVGLVVLMMSITGVLIAWEYQMIESADMKLTAAEHTDGPRISPEQAMAIAAAELGRDVQGVTVRNESAAPYQIAYDRRGTVYVDAYTGEFLGSGSQGVRDFLAPIRNWHRWFNVNGEGRETAQAVTGASNAIFLFLLMSGAYLWLPKISTRAAYKMRLWFKKKPANGKIRDFNWHHVFGIWSLIPLFAIVATATSFSYPAVRDAVNRVTAEPGAPERPPRDGEPRGGRAPTITIEIPDGAKALSLGALLERTQEQAPGWVKISATPARNANSPVEMKINFAAAMQPTKETSWTLNPYTGEIIAERGWQQMTTQEKANQVVRRLHTGEFFGFAGQTIAAAVSLFACFMVWTGLALAWRRLVSPLFSKRRREGVLAKE